MTTIEQLGKLTKQELMEFHMKVFGQRMPEPFEVLSVAVVDGVKVLEVEYTGTKERRTVKLDGKR